MRYISSKIISFSLLINGTSKRFDFNAKTDGGSIYVTDHTDEIKALEASEMYKNGLYKCAAGENPPKAYKAEEGKKGNKGKKGKDVVSIDAVTSLQDAVEYLVSNFDVDASSLTTPDDIAKSAAANNVSFPNMK